MEQKKKFLLENFQEVQLIGQCSTNVSTGITTYLQEKFPHFSNEYVRTVSADLTNIVGNKLEPIIYDYIKLTESKKEELKNEKELKEIFYTVQEVVSFFGVSRQTIHNWCKDGTLKSVKIGGLRRFKKSDIENVFAQ